VAPAQGRSEGALQLLQPLPAAAAAGGSFGGAAEPLEIELTCHRVQAASGDARADAWLVRDHTKLMHKAPTLDDVALSEPLLEKTPAHPELAALWQQ
jgi:hypothetical protein